MVLGVVGETGDADTDTDVKILVVEGRIKIAVLQVGPDPAHDHPGVAVARTGHNNGKFLSTVSAHQVLRAQGFFDMLRDRAQNEVARTMAVRVVEFFEMVDVDHDHGQCLTVPSGPVDLDGKTIVEQSAVVHAGQRVHVRELHEIIGNLDRALDPDLQFLQIKRLDQHAVAAGAEDFDFGFEIVDRGESDDGNEHRAGQPAQLADHLDAVHLGHHDVGEDHAGFFRRGQLKAFAAVGRDGNVEITLLQKIHDDAANGDIVFDDQNPRAIDNVALLRSGHGGLAGMLVHKDVK